MAHYALLDENNIVLNVITGKDENELDNDGNVIDWEIYYSEQTGHKCKRTSYNTVANSHIAGKEPFRGNYAAIGYTYYDDWDVFIPPRPFPSWKLDYSKFQWEAPVPCPEPGPNYAWKWSEINQEWIKVTF